MKFAHDFRSGTEMWFLLRFVGQNVKIKYEEKNSIHQKQTVALVSMDDDSSLCNKI